MRFAVCFSGQCRNLSVSWPIILLNTIKPLQKHGTVDIFFHFWKTPEFNLEEVCKLLQPALGKIQEQMDFSTCRNPFAPTKNSFNIGSMFYSIRECDALRLRIEQKFGFTYNRVVRHRTDRILNYAIPDNLILSNKEEICVRKFGDGTCINDQFAIGSSKMMSIYSQCYSFVYESMTDCPECILGEWFTASDVLRNNTNWLDSKMFWFPDEH